MFKVRNFFQNYKEGNRRLSFTLFWYQINFKETLHSVVHYVTLLYITLRSMCISCLKNVDISCNGIAFNFVSLVQVLFYITHGKH